MRKLMLLLALATAVATVLFTGPAGAVQGGSFDAANVYDNGFLTVPNTHDVGVVVLPIPYTGTNGHFGVLPPLGYLDSLATKRGKQNVNFTVVGYGVQFERPNLEIAKGIRVIGTTQLQDLG